jgi:ribonuclease D
MLINTNDALREFCAALKGNAFIALDTEFMRDRTYWPKLCLVQVAGDSGCAAIDPLAEGIDLAPLFEVLEDTAITKVFHAARQDVEIFYNLTGKVPKPIADTQVMGMVCGFGDAVGYEALVAKMVKGTIDKSSRFTDWSLRPLSDRQLNYALDDVRYLRPVYEKLRAKLGGRESWLESEMAILENPDTYKLVPEESWKRLKAKIDKPKLFALLRELAAWREREAQRLDVPRNRVLRDETLLEIVYHEPADVPALSRVRGFQPDMAKGRVGQEILAAIAKSRSNIPDELPEQFRRKHLPSNIGPIADMLRVLLKSIADQEDIAPKLLANSSDLDELAASDTADIPALQGWRFEVFGKKALELKSGKLAIRMNGKRIEFFEV